MVEIYADGVTPYRIISWDIAKDKFGFSPGMNLKTRGRYFRRSERYMCGCTVIVRHNLGNRTCVVYDINNPYRGLTISIDMLEPLYDEVDDVINEINAVELEKILGIA